MGNTKSKKMKISTETTGDEKNNGERINALKTDISDAATIKVINEDDGIEKDREQDNASSASTVEVLDEK